MYGYRYGYGMLRTLHEWKPTPAISTTLTTRRRSLDILRTTITASPPFLRTNTPSQCQRSSLIMRAPCLRTASLTGQGRPSGDWPAHAAKGGCSTCINRPSNVHMDAGKLGVEDGSWCVALLRCWAPSEQSAGTSYCFALLCFASYRNSDPQPARPLTPSRLYTAS